jgi:UDP-N-acetylmuramoylalanine--D-glutamate ligase
LEHVFVFGLGRSGLAIAKAVQAQGNQAHIFDQASQESISKPELVEEARAVGAEVTLGWDGVLPTDVCQSPTLVTNPAVDSRSPILRSALDRGFEVISEIEFAYRISKAPIIAITGTNGKSTTTAMTYLCLKSCGIEAILCGNIFGSGYPEVPLTEAALNSNSDQILVAEISSFQLEWTKSFGPVCAGITNIRPDHLDRYDSFEDYAAAKLKIFANQTPDDFSVMLANDPIVKPPGGGTSARRVRRMGSVSTASTSGQGTVFTFGATGDDARVDERFLTVLDKQIKVEDLPFSEPHNLTNASMAALLAFGGLQGAANRYPHSKAATVLRSSKEDSQAARALKTHSYNYREMETNKPKFVIPDCVLDGLKQFHGLAHRMEFLGEKGGVRVINNSMCTNPDAVLKSAVSLRGPNHILIGGKNKGLDFRPLRHYFSNQMHHAYLFGEAKEELAEQIGTPDRYETMEEAFAAATKRAKSGEVIMLAPGCASTDQFRDFRQRGDVFKQLAKEWLEK